MKQGKESLIPAGNEELMHFFDPNLTFFIFDFVCFLPWEVFFCSALSAQANNAVRDYIETKN
jgi:hypothetical protein